MSNDIDILYIINIIFHFVLYLKESIRCQVCHTKYVSSES